jgi:uncharacterized protein
MHETTYTTNKNFQAIEEAIGRRLPRVESGAQGEHKLQQGYLPQLTYSSHYSRARRPPPACATLLAVARFLEREREAVALTQAE